MILPITPLSQRDTRWASQRLGTVNGITIGSHGCVITSMSMMANYYNHPILPNQLNDFLTSNRLYYDGDLFVNGSITKLFSDIKFDKVVFCDTTPAPVGEIKKYLDAGKPVVVALINQGIRHYILVVGYEGERIFVNDPWQGDQVAINDRWGDPVRKILQINFFSGPSVAFVPTPAEPVRIDAGGDDHASMHDTPPIVEEPVVEINTETQPVPQNINIGIQPPPAQLRIEAALEKMAKDLNVHRDPEVQITKVKAFFQSLLSRKFILAGLASIVAFINSTFNLGITQDQFVFFMMPILAYIIVEGIADIFERAKK